GRQGIGLWQAPQVGVSGGQTSSGCSVPGSEARWDRKPAREAGQRRLGRSGLAGYQFGRKDSSFPRDLWNASARNSSDSQRERKPESDSGFPLADAAAVSRLWTSQSTSTFWPFIPSASDDSNSANFWARAGVSAQSWRL